MTLFILLSLFMLFSPAFSAHAVNIHYGAPAPQFDLRSINGENVSLSGYKGSIVVLLYWKTDQNYSLGALDDCRELFNTYKGRGIQFVGLVTDTEDVLNVRRIMKEYKIDFPVLVDSGRYVYGAYGIRVYPTTIIVDREGKHSRAIPGHAVTYRKKLEGYLRHMIGEIDEMELLELITLQRKVKAKSESELRAERMYNLALKFAEAGLYRKAIQSAERSVMAKADVSKLHVLRGFLFLATKDVEKALEAFHRALELEPGSNGAKTGLGMAYISRGEIDNGINALKAAVAANPDPQKAYYELGRAYELQGKREEAMEMYKKAIDADIKDNFFYGMRSR